MRLPYHQFNNDQIQSQLKESVKESNESESDSQADSVIIIKRINSDEETEETPNTKTDELPALDDLLQCFTADGVFEQKNKDLLRGFLTDDSLKILDELLAKFAGNNTAIGYVLSVTCNLIFEERFAVFKGEWELIQRKLKKCAREAKSKVDDSTLEQLEQMQCKEE